MTEREVCLKQWLEKIGGSFGLNLKTLRPASSDAGFRSYFRIDGDGTTYIVMDSPGETGNVKPFIFVDDLFAKQGINLCSGRRARFSAAVRLGNSNLSGCPFGGQRL